VDGFGFDGLRVLRGWKALEGPSEHALGEARSGDGVSSTRSARPRTLSLTFTNRRDVGQGRLYNTRDPRARPERRPMLTHGPAARRCSGRSRSSSFFDNVQCRPKRHGTFLY